MVDICLVNWKTERENPEFDHQLLQSARFREGMLHHIDYPLREPPTGLMILAAVLEEKGYSVDILDCTILENPFEYLKNHASSYRMFGFTGLTNTFPEILRLIDITKQINPETYIVAGGPHATFEYEHLLYENPSIDAIFIGEAENTFPWFVEELLIMPEIDFLYSNDASQKDATKNVPRKMDRFFQQTKVPAGLAYRTRTTISNSRSESKQSSIIKYTGFPDTVNLDKLPLPSRHGISRVYSVADIIVNRGCPNQCSFCSRTKLFPTTRIRPLSQILEEVDYILSSANYRFVNFYDNINVNHKYFNEFLDALIERHFHLPWGAELRSDVITQEEAFKLKKANCKLVATGIESASSDVLKKNFKFQNPEKVAQGISRLKKEGVGIQAYFMIGLPGDNEEIFEKTLAFLRRLPLKAGEDHVNFFVTTPYPGCDLVINPEKYGIKVLSHNYHDYTCSNILIETPTLNQDQMATMVQKAKKLTIELGLN
ncbi:MAG: B12-binding domain-containing radical SAM protein [Promethearchaeota archaeon]